MERVLKGHAKAKFTEKANLVGRRTVANFSMLMATMTVHIFPAPAYQDQKSYMYRYWKETQNNESMHYYYQAYTVK